MKTFTTKVDNLTDPQSQKLLKEYGWLCHFVFDHEVLDADFHTHGLPENFNHTNLQIALSLIDPKIAHGIITSMVQSIAEGRNFEKEGLYDEVIKNFPVEIQKTKDDVTGKELLRVIFPDPNGFFPNDPKCQKEYRVQYLRLTSLK